MEKMVEKKIDLKILFCNLNQAIPVYHKNDKITKRANGSLFLPDNSKS